MSKYHETVEWDRNVELWAQELGVEAIRLLEDYLSALVEHYAPQIEDWMKFNAMWQDRTGNARRGLHADVETMVGDAYSIILDHGDDVPYGVWLETRWQGKYAIIQPALDVWFPLIVNDIKRFLR